MKTFEVAQMVDVFGKVQGVGYRYYVQNIAVQYGVKGWIKNMEDGSVKSLLVGKQDSIASVISFMKKGPALARIDNLVARDYPLDETIKFFAIR